jgi:hypothetical protein
VSVVVKSKKAPRNPAALPSQHTCMRYGPDPVGRPTASTDCRKPEAEAECRSEGEQGVQEDGCLGCAAWCRHIRTPYQVCVVCCQASDSPIWTAPWLKADGRCCCKGEEGCRKGGSLLSTSQGGMCTCSAMANGAVHMMSCIGCTGPFSCFLLVIPRHVCCHTPGNWPYSQAHGEQRKMALVERIDRNQSRLVSAASQQAVWSALVQHPWKTVEVGPYHVVAASGPPAVFQHAAAGQAAEIVSQRSQWHGEEHRLSSTASVSMMVVVWCWCIGKVQVDEIRSRRTWPAAERDYALPYDSKGIMCLFVPRRSFPFLPNQLVAWDKKRLFQ